jgi:hypothetical protein
MVQGLLIRVLQGTEKNNVSYGKKGLVFPTRVPTVRQIRSYIFHPQGTEQFLEDLRENRTFST